MSITYFTQHQGVVPNWTLGDRIRKAREIAGLSSPQLAKLMHVSPRTLWSFENNKREPRPMEMREIAIQTNVNYEWLVTGSENPTGPEGPDGGLLPDLDSNQEPADSWTGATITQITPKTKVFIPAKKVA